jgi:hypothetical protein
MWWPVSQFQHRVSRIVAESGERLEVWWVVPSGRERASHYELRHYVPEAGQELTDGAAIGGCFFVQGVNDAVYIGVDANRNGQPDCFLKTSWFNFDFGADDQPADGLLGVRVFEYFVCQDLRVVTLRKHEYGCGDPPENFPTPRCTAWLGPVRSITTESVTRGHGGSLLSPSAVRHALFTPLTDPFEDLVEALASQGVEATNVAMGVIEVPAGDVDLSLSFGQGDYATVAEAIGSCLGDSNYVSLADVNGDGCVSISDLQSLFQSDSDDDGMLDWQEWIAGTDAFDSDSVLRISFVQRPASGNVVLRWPSTTGRTYTVLRSSVLPWGISGALITNLVATPPLNTFEDQTATNSMSYFYRLEVR